MLPFLNIIIKVVYSLESNISNIIPLSPNPRISGPFAYPYRSPYSDPLLKGSRNRSELSSI